MPKLKTHKGTKKRFRVTKNGRVKRRGAFTSHLLSSRNPKRLRKLRKQVVCPPCDEKRVHRLLND